MRIRPLEASDIARWIELRAKLWPDQSPAELDEEGRAALTLEPPALVVFVAEENGGLVGFLELGLRSYGEGCASSPVPYVEGWYVEAEWRRRGVGGALMRAAEERSRARGYGELGSDTEEFNQLSRAAHAALGFEEVETLVVFRKPLADRGAIDAAGEPDSAIDALYTAWSEAFCRQDLEAILDLLTPDYVLWAPGAPPMDRDALRPRLAAALTAYEIVPSFEREERLVSGELAFERGWDVQQIRPRDGGEIRSQRLGVFLLLRRGTDGKWRFARGMSQSGPDATS
jgi:aminoglycoside 6'-N-acetyltransferase I